MAIDKIFKVGILFLGVCVVAVLVFSSLFGKRYESIRSENALAVLDQKTGRIYASDGVKSVAVLDLINGKRTFKPLALTNGGNIENDLSKVEKKGPFDDLVPSNKLPAQ